MSTLTVPANLSSPRQDAIELYNAFKERYELPRVNRSTISYSRYGYTVVKILAYRDANQRSLIQQEYKAMYSEELTAHLSKELSGNFKRAMLLWVLDPASRDATILREALSGDGEVDLYAATEILCSRTPSQIQIIKQTYLAQFGAYLEHDVQYQTAVGDHQKLLLSYIGTPKFDHSLVPIDAEDLFETGQKKLAMDEKLFIRIFSERSRAHLVAVAHDYHMSYGHSLEKAVRRKTSGLFQLALLTILGSAMNPGKYFAKVLHKAMKGVETDDPLLMRTVVTRAEIDMKYIRSEYQRKYMELLADAIYVETSGHYQAFFLALLNFRH